MALTGEMKLSGAALTAAICLYLRSEGLEPQSDVRWGTQKKTPGREDERENVAYVEVRTGERLIESRSTRTAPMDANESEEYEALCDLLGPELEPGEILSRGARRLLRELKDLRFQIQRLSVSDPVGDLLRALPEIQEPKNCFWCVIPSLTNTAFEAPTHASLQLRRTSEIGSDLVASRYVSLASGEREGVLATARRMLRDHAVPLEQNPEWQEIEQAFTAPEPISSSSPVPDEPKLIDLVDQVVPTPDGHEPVTIGYVGTNEAGHGLYRPVETPDPKPTDFCCDNCPATAAYGPGLELPEGWMYVSELDGALFCPKCYADLPESAKTTPTTNGEAVQPQAAATGTEVRVFTEAPGPETTERLKRDYASELKKARNGEVMPIPDQVPCVAALGEAMKDGMQRAATAILQNEGKSQGRRKKSDPKPKEPESEVSL